MAEWLDWPTGDGLWWLARPGAPPEPVHVRVETWDDTDYGAPGPAVSVDTLGSDAWERTPELVGRGYRWHPLAPPPEGKDPR